MYKFEQQMPVRIQFRAMTESFAINVPGHILRYLDTHAERTFTPEGGVIYHQISIDEGTSPLPCKRSCS